MRLSNHFRFCVKGINFLLIILLVLTPLYSYAQTAFIENLPAPGIMVAPSVPFVPILLKGMRIYPNNPLRFDFIVDSGNTKYTSEQVKQESSQLVKYFFAAITIPQDDLWVNLSPYEANRIIPDALGKTDLGRDLLAQDYILKQLSASFLDPQKDFGKDFWARIYEQTQKEFGISKIDINAFNRIWIMPEEAIIYEKGNAVYVVKSRLKVMLDQDYKAEQVNKKKLKTDIIENLQINTTTPVSTQILREIILPEITREVNEGKNFAVIRQIYQALILAEWYKQTAKDGLFSKVYIDKKKTRGVELLDQTIKDQLYSRYVEAFKKGVVHFVKEDYDPLSQEVIPKKYFIGGAIFGNIPITKSPPKKDVTMVGDNYTLAIEADPLWKTSNAEMIAKGRARLMLIALAEKELRHTYYSVPPIDDNVVNYFLQLNGDKLKILTYVFKKLALDFPGNNLSPEILLAALSIVNEGYDFKVSYTDDPWLDWHDNLIYDDLKVEKTTKLDEAVLAAIIPMPLAEENQGVLKVKGIDPFDWNDPGVQAAFKKENSEVVLSIKNSQDVIRDAYIRREILPIHYTVFPNGQQKRYYLQARQFFIKKFHQGFEHPTFNNVHLLAAMYYYLEKGYLGALSDDPEERLVELFKQNNIKHILEVGTSGNNKFAIILNSIIKQVDGSVSIIDLADDNAQVRKLGITTVQGDARKTKEYFNGKKFDLILNSGVLSRGGVGAMGDTANIDIDIVFNNAMDLLHGLIDSLSDNQKAAVVANGIRSHLVLLRTRVSENFDIELWDNAFERHPYFNDDLKRSYKNISALNALRSDGASLVIIKKRNNRNNRTTDRIYEHRNDSENIPQASTAINDVGGIDMNRIHMKRQNSGPADEFKQAIFRDIRIEGVDGFAPVIINITPIKSILPILGVKE